MPQTERSLPFSFYPPLYATPSQQRPPSPTSFSPSPYVVNFKRRGPVQSGGKVSVVEPLTDPFSQQRQEQHQRQQQQQSDDFGDGKVGRLAENNEIHDVASHREESLSIEVPVESEVFEMELEKRDRINVLRINGCVKKALDFSSDHSVNGLPDINTAYVPISTNEELEFFDAPDSVFSDSASEDEACPSNVALPVYEGRIAGRLLEEIARRVTAEEAVAYWQSRWNEMARRCSSQALDRLDVDSSESFSQELLVARLVEGAVVRAAFRAEKEEELDIMLASKNREISRLRDKLQYLELVNREMSQKNQEVTETTQRRRRRRQRRQRWALGGFCTVLCIGTCGMLCYKFIPWDQAKAWTNFFQKSL